MKLLESTTMAETMDVRFLTTFLEVSKTRHFGKAAENLYLTQSAVSARIKLLEEHFNTALFVRHRNSIQLTAAGEKLIPYAQNIANMLTDARRDLGEEEVEYLVCAATPNASELYLQEGLTRIQTNFPALSVRAEIFPLEQLSRQLHERSIDLAYSIEPLKSDEIENLPIFEDTLGLFAYQCRDLNTALDKYFHIDWGNKISEVIHGRYPRTKRAKLRTSSFRVALDCFFAEGGCALLPHSVVNSHPRRKDIHLLESFDELVLTTYMAYMRDVKNPGLQELISFHRPD